MTMCGGYADPFCRGTAEIEFNEHGRLVSDDPGIVSWRDGHNPRGGKFQNAAILILDVNLTSGEKSHVRVHADIGSDNRLDVRGPAKAWRIDQALDARPAHANRIHLNAAGLVMLRSFDGRRHRIGGIHLISSLASTIAAITPRDTAPITA